MPSAVTARAAREPTEPLELLLSLWLWMRTGTKGQVLVPVMWRAGEELQGRRLGGRGRWLCGPPPEGQVRAQTKKKKWGGVVILGEETQKFKESCRPAPGTKEEGGRAGGMGARPTPSPTASSENQ